jgi:hypothetical protein
VKEGSKALLKSVLPPISRALGIPLRGCISAPLDTDSPTTVAGFPSSASDSPLGNAVTRRHSWSEKESRSIRGLGPRSNGTMKTTWDGREKQVGGGADSERWVEEDGYDLATGIRLISYCSVAWTVTEVMPYVFQYLSF